MKSGKMVHVIKVERPETLVTPAGSAQDRYEPFATLRAELVRSETDVIHRNAGDTPEVTRVFRTRWLSGLKTSDTVLFRGTRFKIRELIEIGRQHGLELRCIEMEASYEGC